MSDYRRFSRDDIERMRREMTTQYAPTSELVDDAPMVVAAPGTKTNCSRCGRRIREKATHNSWGRVITVFQNHAADCPQRGAPADRYVP